MASSYFSHDSNARNSKKLLRLRQAHGAAGYGVYFMLLERLREEGGYTSDRDYDMIAYDLREDKELIRAVVEDFGLFEISSDGKQFQSKGFMERMELREIRSQAGRKGASGRWGSFLSDDSKKEKKVKRESKKSDGKNDEIMKIDDDKNPAQNGSKWQNDSKSDNLPMALNKNKDKRKEINKEKSVVTLNLHTTTLNVPFDGRPYGKAPYTLEIAMFMAWELHMQHPLLEAERMLAYNRMNKPQSKNYCLAQWMAAARLWQTTCKDQQPDTRWDDSDWCAFWESLTIYLVEKKQYDLLLQTLGSAIIPGAKSEDVYALVVTNDLYEWIERNLDMLMTALKKLLESKGFKSTQLGYTIVNNKL